MLKGSMDLVEWECWNGMVNGLECWNGMTTNLGAYNDHLWAKTTLKLDYPVKRLIANL